MARIVILGTAHPHIFGLAKLAGEIDGHEMVGVFDNDPQRLQESAARMELKPLESLEAALASRPDLALIGAAPSERAGLAEAAVSAGSAVLADKPLALTGEALERVRSAAQRTGKTVGVYYPYRGSPFLQTMRRMLREGRIGKAARILATGPHMLAAVSRPAWHWTREGNGGILIDIGSHYLDACNWLLGEYPVEVSAADGNIGHPEHAEFQDFGHARLRYPSGAMAYVEVDWLSPETAGYDSRFWIQGTEGKIELRLGKERSLRWWTPQVDGDSIDVEGLEAEGEWSKKLIADLAAGRAGDIPQEEIWNASRLSLAAFESARIGKVFAC